MLRFEIDGALKVSDSSGRICTPRGAKARGLVALLLTAKDFTRSRRYLQDKLWSTRAPEQASASLRQVLSELRRDFGQDKSVIVCERGNVQFDSDAIEIVRTTTVTECELFEDVDVCDPEFEDWIRDLRQLDASDVCPPTPVQPPTSAPIAERRHVPTLVFRSAQDLHDVDAWMYHVMRERIVASARELGDVEFCDMNDPLHAQKCRTVKPSLYIAIDVSSVPGMSFASVRVESPSGYTFWRSQLAKLQDPTSDESHFVLGCISNHTCQAVGEYFSDSRAQADAKNLPLALALRGRGQMFDFSRHALINADRVLASAYEMDPKPVYAAWRAFVRNTAMFEHLTQDFLEPLDNDDLISTAMREDPTNSMVLAFAAQHSFVHLRDASYGAYLCERSIEINDANPISRAFLANYLTALGDYDAAIGSAEKGVALASGQAEKNFLTIFSCMARIGVEDYARATSDATLASAQSPNFLAIRRFLFALHCASNRLEKASSIERDIRKREPDFNRDRLFDSNYPVGTMRSTPIMSQL